MQQNINITLKENNINFADLTGAQCNFAKVLRDRSKIIDRLKMRNKEESQSEMKISKIGICIIFALMILFFYQTKHPGRNAP